MTYFYNFRTPHISRTVKARNINYGTHALATGAPNKKNAKLGQKGPRRRHVTYFYNFGIPSVYREQLKLETSNLACRLATAGPKRSNAKLGQKLSIRVT